MTRTFKTMTGSTYEVDTVGKRVRRISGNIPQNDHLLNTRDWKEYSAFHITKENCLLFIWQNDIHNATITSPIIDPHEDMSKTMN